MLMKMTDLGIFSSTRKHHSVKRAKEVQVLRRECQCGEKLVKQTQIAKSPRFRTGRE